MNILDQPVILPGPAMPASQAEPDAPSYSSSPPRAYHAWTPRFWNGMDFSTWMRLLVRNRFAVSPSRVPLALSITASSALNSFANVFGRLMFAHRVRNTELKEPPLFVIGHWRSGTTLLHELLMLDPRHICPNTYQCFDPIHFLWTEWFVPTLIRWALPKTRPMDDVKAGWDRPQEDEFALANLGMPSPYLGWAFPNHGPVADEYLDLLSLPSAEREAWKRTWREFVQRIALARNGRIVLKSPTHTARVRTILEVFPDARFVHIVRDPLVLFPSTLRLWKSLSEVQGVQVPRDNNGWLERQVLDTFVRMYQRFEQDRELVPRGHLVDVRYEDLVADPVGWMREIYGELGLGDFAAVEPALLRHAVKTRDYRTNQYSLPPEVADRVRGRWAPYFQRYGYNGHEAASASA
jgi:omega-hydroxy-beta-dihydromenaquinone-9 sulfotransferase